MPLAEKTSLLSNLCPPLDSELAEQVVDEFIALERRYVLRDWGPAELDGGRFAEALARLLYHQDSGNINRTKGVVDCLRYLENETVSHAISPRHNALHLVRVIRTIYKLRSQRGAIHISPHYSANHLDARLIAECVRWAFNELLRICWSGDRAVVARTIRELLQFDVPCVGKFDDIVLVQRTDVTPEEEILVLLHHAGEEGFNRKQLGKHSQAPPQRVTDAIKKLVSPALRQVIKLSSGSFCLTDLGHKRIREQLADKLSL